MCPSITCPNCDQPTFHRGTCENKQCLYDPNAADLNIKDGRKLFDILQDQLNGSTLEPRVLFYRRPFPRVHFSASDQETINDLAERIGYEGPYFSFEPYDMFYTEPAYGFDLVKDKAEPLLAVAEKEGIHIHG